MGIRARRLPIELAEGFLWEGIPATEESPGGDKLTRLKLELFHDVLERGLTKKQKCYIILYYRDAMTMDEIAAKYGVNKSSVSRSIKAARRKINESVLKYFNKYI